MKAARTGHFLAFTVAVAFAATNAAAQPADPNNDAGGSHSRLTCGFPTSTLRSGSIPRPPGAETLRSIPEPTATSPVLTWQ